MKNPIKSAIKGDKESVNVLFSQFLDSDERITDANYFGFNGLWHMGYHSFGCLTDRRACSLKVGWLGSVSYIDGFLEDINSISVKQPSLFLLYFLGILFVVLTLGVGLLLLPLFVRLFYRYFKSGMTVNVRSGSSVYVFCDRDKIKLVDNMLRALSVKRENRLSTVFGITSRSRIQEVEN